MFTSSAYTVTEALGHGHRAFLYRALRNADGRSVLLKMLDPQCSRPKDLERLKHEYELGELLVTPAVVKPLALGTYEGMPTLVFEDFGGQSLDRLLGVPMAVDRFLPLAIRMAGVVADIHDQGIVHKDLKPQNFLIDLATGAVKIANLAIASQLPRQRVAPQSPSRIEGSLPYMSPEQTGRMNRSVDGRSDLYALGVTFYQMLTGRLPFEAKDPLEWVHCHVARTPRPPSKTVAAVPDVLSGIVLKLLAKMAEDRYQTARGLQRDLERCHADWQARGSLTPFCVGEHDVSDQFEIGQKLYGRDAEVAELFRAFEGVASQGTSELVLVSGYSGIGKSSLVCELHRPIVRARGFFTSGKPDQLKRDVPYSAIVQAFAELVEQILTESDERIVVWRAELQQALGSSGRLIVDLIPRLELVIGVQPPVPPLPPLKAQNRFHRVFRQLVGVFARKDHPLALFLDDLQWLDSGSLRLIEDIVLHPQSGYLLILGAYRDNEVGPSHPLRRMLDEIREANAVVHELVLAPLTVSHLTQFITDALRPSPERAAALAELVHDKTRGNPFFVIQFLTALHDERLIEFDGCTLTWRWDLAKIRARSFTDNVADLMVGKLEQLPAPTQRILEQLAALGNDVDIGNAVLVHGGSEQQLHADLQEAICAGLILRSDHSYKFLHDRVQEAAYSLIPEERRAADHLAIGRLLLSHTPAAELEETIFDIVNQLNRGAMLLTSRQERDRVAELNLVAARRARKSTACVSAHTYLVAGHELLAEDCWERQYELTFAFELGRAECEYLIGAPEAEDRLAALWHNAKGPVDKAAVTCASVALYTTLDRSDRAVAVCLDYLQLVGIHWSPHPSDEEVQQEHERMWQALGSRGIAELVDLPALVDPTCRATVDVLTAVQSPALFTDENLHWLVVERIVNLSLEYGNSDGSCLAYVRLGMILGQRFGDYQAGFRLGKAGLDLVEKRGLLRYKARVYLDFGHLVSPWTRHIHAGLPFLRRAFDVAQETGDLLYASYTCNCSITLLLAEGEVLGEVQRRAERWLEFVNTNKFGLVADILAGQLGLIRALRGLSPDFRLFAGGELEEARFEQHLEGDPRLAIAACWYWIRKLQARFHAGDYAAAIEAASKAERLLWTSPAFFEIAEYHFFGALAHAAHHDTAPADEGPRHLEAITAHHAQLAVWAKSCPENFENRAALVAAELARIEGQDLDAMRHYEVAVASAQTNGFVHNEALAHELAAGFFRARGFGRFADSCLCDARAGYARWGAEGKVRQLDQRLARLLEPNSALATATFAARPEQLDLLSVTKASQTISGEIVLDKLVCTLLEVVLQQGGAQRALLMLCRGEDLSIEAEAALEDGGTAASVLQSEPAESSLRIPTSVVNYVLRMKERVILGNAAAEAGKFSADEYITRVRPRSVLCMPILRQAEVVGLLYLENNVLTGAFTSDRLAALELLATQAAISLQNAQLLANERAARATAEQAERRAAFLAEAGMLLSESLDYEETLARLGRLCVRSLNAECVLDIVEGREIRRLVVAEPDPAKEPLLRELQRRYPVRWDSPHAAAVVLRTGKSLLITELSDDCIRRFCVDDEHYRLIRQIGMQSVLAVPLVVRGQALGVLTISSCTPGRRYGPADLELVEEVARRAAGAIDKGRLYHASQEAVRARSEFLTVASHELNTPVTSLMLALQSLRQAAPSRRPLTPQALDKLLDLAVRQGVRLTKLVNDLLDVSRLEAGKLPLELTDVDLGVLVSEVVERLEPDLARSRCPVSMTGDAGIVGRWDRSRIDRVVTNLLSNALKFGAGKPIELSVGSQRDIAWLAVRDHGIGVDLAQRDRIFERFERAVSERHYGGLGLGLYISRMIVENHGGSIRCESSPGAGSTFIVVVPRAPPPPR